MPRKAIATPTAPSTTYFQAASSAFRPPPEATRKAVVIVVSSIATHISPRLSAVTASVIAARNRHSSAAWTPPARSSVPGSGRPPQSEITATAPTTLSSQALRGSARSRPAPATTAPEPCTATSSAIPASSTTAAAAIGSHIVQRRRRRPKPSAASRDGSSRGSQIRAAISRAAPSVR